MTIVSYESNELIDQVILVTGGYGLVGFGIQAVVNSGSGDEFCKKDDEVKP